MHNQESKFLKKPRFSFIHLFKLINLIKYLKANLINDDGRKSSKIFLLLHDLFTVIFWLILADAGAGVVLLIQFVDWVGIASAQFCIVDHFLVVLQQFASWIVQAAVEFLADDRHFDVILFF